MKNECLFLCLLFCNLPLLVQCGYLINHKCSNNTECLSGCCGYASFAGSDRYDYICQEASFCYENLMFGSECMDSDECQSNCCSNNICQEFDVCFTEIIKPILDKVFVAAESFFAVCILVIWIWIFYNWKKTNKARKIIREFNRHVEYLANYNEMARLNANNENNNNENLQNSHNNNNIQESQPSIPLSSS